MALADEFNRIFREEHRKVRDALLDLIEAFCKREKNTIQTLLERIAALTGPHFRYEEESLYPVLVAIFGQKYIDHLYSEHDRAIGRAEYLVRLSQKNELSEDDVEKAVDLIRAILPHVSDCDGLSIMVEKLPEEKVKDVLETRARTLKANLNLIEWARQVRKRPAAVEV